MNNIGKLGGARAVLFGVVATVIVMVVLSFVVSMIVYFTPLNETILSSLAMIVNALALLAGGFVAGKISGSKGLLTGLAVAVVMLVLMMIFGASGAGELALKIVYCLLCGMIGGIFGVR